MNPVAEEATFDVVDPRSEGAVWAMTQYFKELDQRFEGGFEAGDSLASDAPSFDPPKGAFVLVNVAEEVVGCGGLLTLAPGLGEIKRMWITKHFRGVGLGPRLLSNLEDRCKSCGHEKVRLDTNSALTQAIAMYRRLGYIEIPRYNENPYARHWFEKKLS